MLEKLKTWIYNNYFLVSSLIVLSVLFYLSLNSYSFYPLFLLFLLFVNYYYLRGLEILINTIFYPLPIIFLSILTQASNYLIALSWFIYYLIFLKNKKIGWIIHLILIVLILTFLINKYSLLWITMFVFLIFFFVIYSGFNKNFLSSFLISLFVSEVFWLFYFLPLNIYLRTFILFLFFIWILNQELI